MFVMALKNGERKMNQFVPKLFDCMKSYTKEQFVKDVIAGIIVAIIALPLSIALALASGVGPEQGIYTAIFAGFVISFLGGSRVQIAGPTAAFATIVAGIVAEHQMEKEVRPAEGIEVRKHLILRHADQAEEIVLTVHDAVAQQDEDHRSDAEIH